MIEKNISQKLFLDNIYQICLTDQLQNNEFNSHWVPHNLGFPDKSKLY